MDFLFCLEVLDLFFFCLIVLIFTFVLIYLFLFSLIHVCSLVCFGKRQEQKEHKVGWIWRIWKGLEDREMVKIYCVKFFNKTPHKNNKTESLPCKWSTVNILYYNNKTSLLRISWNFCIIDIFSKTYLKLGLDRWLSVYEYWLVFHQTQGQLPQHPHISSEPSLITEPWNISSSSVFRECMSRAKSYNQANTHACKSLKS